MDLTQDRAMLKTLYMPGSGDFVEVTVPALLYAVIDGAGAPGASAVASTIRSLLGAIQPIRREARVRMGKAFVEAPVELLYWADDPRDLLEGRRDKWHWRAMIVLPAWTDQALFDQSVQQVSAQLGPLPPTLRMMSFAEGRCVQIMQVGHADQIAEVLERLYTRFLPDHKLEPGGPYHEIYLDDWSRAAPDKRKLILRQPVRPARAS